MGRGRAVIAGLAVVAIVAIAIVALTGDEPRSYGPSEVADALRTQGLDVRETGRVDGGAALMPPDDSFTVVVLGSDGEARDAFRQYEGDTDPDTFELRAANVLILADGSNAETPLSAVTRARIRRAVAALAAP